MSIQLAQLEVAFVSTGASKVRSDIAGVNAAIDEGAVAGAGSLTKLAGGAGLLADAALVASVGVATSFQTLVTKIQNNTTMSNADIANMTTSIKTLASQSGASLTELANGYMHASNFGFDFATSQDIVTAAMKSAISTGGDVSATANVLAAAMKEFGLQGTQAAGAMDTLHLAAARGNMTLDQLVESAGPAISTAANLGDTLPDVSAALSTLTQHGFDASRAATQVTGMLTHIVNPSKAATAELQLLSKTTGVDLVSDFSEAGLKGKGLAGIMEDVGKATGGNTDQILKLIPALRGGQGALVLAGNGMADMATNLDQLSQAFAGKLTPTEEAFQRQQETFAAGWDRLKANLQLAGIAIGTVLLPPLTTLMNVLGAGVSVIAAFAQQHATLAVAILGVVGALGTAIGGMAVFGSLASVIGPVLGPIVALLGAIVTPLLVIGAAAAALYVAWQQDWGGIREVVAGAWSAMQPGLALLKTALDDIVTAGGRLLSGNVSGALGALGSAAQAALSGLGSIGGAIGTALGSINWGGMLSGAGSAIVDGLKAGGGLTLQLAGWIGSEIAAIPWSSLWSGIQGAGSAIVAGLEAGGSIAVSLGTWLAGEVAAVPWATVWGGIKSAGSAVLSGLQKGANITVQLGQWLASEVAGVDWSVVWGGIQSAGSAILRGLEAGADITAQLGQWLGSQVAGIDWTSVWSNAKGAAGAAVAAISNGAQAAATGAQTVGNAAVAGSQAATKAAQDHQSAIAGVGDALAGAGGDALSGITSGVQNLASLVSGPLAQVKQMLSDLGDAINNRLGPARAVIDGLGSAFSSLTSGALASLGNLVETAATQMERFGSSTVAAVLSTIATVVSQNEQAFSRWVPVVSEVANLFSAVFAPAVTVLMSIIGGVAALLAGTAFAAFAAFTKGVQALADILSAVLPGAFEAATGITQTFLGVIQTVSGIVSGVVAVVGDLLSGNWSQAWKDAQTAVQNVVNGLLTILGGLGATLSGLIDAGLSLVKASFQAAWDAITTAFSTTIGAMTTLAGTIGGLIVGAVGDLGSLLYNAGTAVVQGLINGITSKIGDLASAAGSLLDTITSHKGPIEVDRVALVPHGQALVSGLIDGMNEQIPPLITTASNLGTVIASILSGPDVAAALQKAAGDLAVKISNAVQSAQQTAASLISNLGGMAGLLTGGTTVSPLSASPALLAQDQAAAGTAQQSALQAAAQAQQALRTLGADQAAYAQALQQGDYDLANSINARIPAEQAAAQAAQANAQTTQQAYTTAAASVTADNAALKTSATDLAAFTMNAAHSASQGEADLYRKMYEAVQANAQTAYATLQRGVAGYETAIQHADVTAQGFYKHLIDGATQALNLDQQQSAAILQLNQALGTASQTASNATAAVAQAGSAAVTAGNATVQKSYAAGDTGPNIGPLTGGGGPIASTLALLANAQLMTEMQQRYWQQSNATLQALAQKQQQPLQVNVNVNLDGQQISRNTEMQYSRDLRVRAPLVGAPRIGL